MPVRVADEVIDNVHHVIPVGIAPHDDAVRGRVAVGRVDIHGFDVDQTARLRGHQPTGADRLAPIVFGLVAHLIDGEALGDSAGEQLVVNLARRAVLVEPENPVAPHPCFGRDALCGDVPGGVGRVEERCVLHRQRKTAERNIHKCIRERMVKQADGFKRQLFLVRLDPIDVGERQRVVGDGDLRAIPVSDGLLFAQRVENLLGIRPVERQHARGAPMLKIADIAEPRVHVVALLQIEVVGHERGIIHRAGAVRANGGHAPVQVHDEIRDHGVHLAVGLSLSYNKKAGVSSGAAAFARGKRCA